MLKLYKKTGDKKLYWETWENNGVHTIHWGELGTRGQSKELKSSLFKKAETVIQKEIDGLVQDGYAPADPDEAFILMIEYVVDGMGSPEDLEKRHRLEGRMNETLGWTGLGNCDGGSIGTGSMEVCCIIVDFETARTVIEEDLRGTEFENFTRIYDENE